MSVISASHSVPLPLVSVVGDIDVMADGFSARTTADRDAVVNRVLDWSEAARARGREERAQRLLCLAWEAFDRA